MFSAHLAACVLSTVDRLDGVEGKEILDLGCGCGMLTFASCIFDCR